MTTDDLREGLIMLDQGFYEWGMATFLVDQIRLAIAEGSLSWDDLRTDNRMLALIVAKLGVAHLRDGNYQPEDVIRLQQEVSSIFEGKDEVWKTLKTSSGQTLEEHAWDCLGISKQEFDSLIQEASRK